MINHPKSNWVVEHNGVITWFPIVHLFKANRGFLIAYDKNDLNIIALANCK
jgi:hypothetical protein